MITIGRGGARQGAGRPPSDREPSQAQVDFEVEKAAHEKVKREEREFKLELARGEHLPRAAVQQASATAFSVLAQTLQAIPVNLERVCGLTPEQTELAQAQIDTAMMELSRALKAMAGEP